MRHPLQCFVAATLFAAATCLSASAGAAVRIAALYSSPDGEYQAILLEDDVHDGVDRFAGITLMLQDQDGRARSFTLSGERLRERPALVDGRERFLVGTRRLGHWLQLQAELPDAFLATAGGTLAIFGGPQLAYPLLDEGGALAIDANGGVHASNHALARHPRVTAEDYFAAPVPAPLVREYRHMRAERYRLATLQPEKARLDDPLLADWQRTGRTFRSLGHSPVNGQFTVPVCQFRLPGDEAFFSGFAVECDAVGRNVAAAVLETREAFRVVLPDPLTGLCNHVGSTPLRAVYRSWDGGTNHRYTTDADEQADMVSRGWIAEGYGPNGAAMCVDGDEPAAVSVPKLRPR
jgi:hypothetical protein